MLFLDILKLQAVLIMLMLVGLVCKKTGIIDNHSRKGLINFCLDVIIPCNVIKAGMTKLDPDIARSGMLTLICGFVVLILTVIANRFLFRKTTDDHRRIMQYCMVASMSGFFGNPIAEALFGAEGIILVSLFLISVRVAVWSMGNVYYVKEKMSLGQLIKKAMINPPMIGTFIGLLFMATGWQLPALLMQPISQLSACTSPVIMVVVGTFLADLDFRKGWDRDTLEVTLFRLILLPLLAWGTGLLLGLRGPGLTIAVFMTGTPAGSTAMIYAERYGSDTEFATRCVAMTTLFSLVSMPLWCYFVR